MQRNGRSVRRDIRPRLTHRIDFRIERRFDLGIFDHRLDDPIDIGKFGQIVFQIARGYQLCRTLVHEGRGIGFKQFFDCPFGNHAAIGRTFRHDIQQQYRHAGIGDMRGDRRPHHAGAKHGDFLYGHRQFLRRD